MHSLNFLPIWYFIISSGILVRPYRFIILVKVNNNSGVTILSLTIFRLYCIFSIDEQCHRKITNVTDRLQVSSKNYKCHRKITSVIERLQGVTKI